MPAPRTIVTPPATQCVAWLWLGEKISGATVASLLVGFAGVVLILRPGLALLHDPSAAIAVLAAVCSSIALVTANRLSTTEPTSRILFYYFLTATLLTGPLVPFGWHPPTGRQWACLVGIGLCMASGQLLVILAYHYARPAAISPFNYSVVVSSGLIGWAVWDDVPGLPAVAGVLLVSLGGALSTVLVGPNARGHFGWVGHWDLPFVHCHPVTAGAA